MNRSGDRIERQIANDSDAVSRQRVWGVLTLTLSALGLVVMMKANPQSAYSADLSGAAAMESGVGTVDHVWCEMSD
jgi:hypothetical protein